MHAGCSASFLGCFIQDKRHKAIQLLLHFTHSGTNAADVSSPHPAVGSAVAGVLGPTTKARVSASLHTGFGTLTHQMTKIKLTDIRSVSGQIWTQFKWYNLVRVLLDRAVCFKFRVNPLSRCASTAQMLGDAKCTLPPTHTKPFKIKSSRKSFFFLSLFFFVVVWGKLPSISKCFSLRKTSR